MLDERRKTWLKTGQGERREGKAGVKGQKRRSERFVRETQQRGSELPGCCFFRQSGSEHSELDGSLPGIIPSLSWLRKVVPVRCQPSVSSE